MRHKEIQVQNVARFSLESSEDGWSALLVDTDMGVEEPVRYYERMAGLFDSGLPLERVLAEASFGIRRGFHQDETQKGRHCPHQEPCYTYALRLQENAGAVLPALARDIEDDTDAKHRVLVALVYKGCPNAKRCMQYFLEEARLRDRPEKAYRDMPAVRRDMERVMKELLFPFDEPAEAALHTVGRSLGLGGAASVY